LWTQLARQVGIDPMRMERGLVVDTAVLAAQYALSGHGIALVDTNLFGEELRAGHLVKPFDVTLDDDYGYYLITHPEGLADTAIALFRSWLIERFGRGAVGITGQPAVQLAVSNE
ncbi:MAG: LysR substrate-binding domain-containing protein, partial [Steroidobacteraceae bacterium]